MTMRARLDLAYDGTEFSGWATQPGLRTCQGELEAALATVLQQPARVTVAGRTDAGVHASGQVAHVDLSETFALDARLANRLTALIAARAHGKRSDLVVASATVAPAGFDARFSAVARRYRYRVQTGTDNPLTSRFAAWHARALDVTAMRQVAGELIGLNDFAAFCKPREGATTIRRLISFDWHDAGSGLYEATLAADAFCHSMVRSLVGACIAVGEGRLGLAAAASLLDAQARSSAFRMMPACGLTLERVEYPPDAELGFQAQRARARRSLDAD